MPIDLEQFHQAFFEESFEGLEIMESGLLNLDPGRVDVESINTIFRAAHSIKGGSGTFGFTRIAEFTHGVETLLDEVRGERREITREFVDLLLQSVDCLREMLSFTKTGQPIDTERVAQTQYRLDQLLHGAMPQNAQSSTAEQSVEAESAGDGWHIKFRPHLNLFRTGNDPFRLIRELDTLGKLSVRADSTQIPTFTEIDPEACYLAWELKLESNVSQGEILEIFEWVEDECALEILPLIHEQSETEGTAEGSQHSDAIFKETFSEKQVEQRSGVDRRRADRRQPAPSKELGSIRVNTDKIDNLINLVSELVITQSMLSQLGTQFEIAQFEKMRDGLEQLKRNTRELQESVMQIRMLPISFSFNRFPRLIHDLSAKLDKRVELKLSGEQTELDKTVLEKIGDPLVHLVRNALDHGIEAPELRRMAGKAEIGTVFLQAYHQGGNVVIEIADDGAGLQKEKLLRKARERGLIGQDEQLSDEKIYDLIFHPGFSTAGQVSDVSGRGVGMDVVKRNIKDLGGTVEIASTEGKGSKFTIRLPLTLAILDGQLVRVGEETYIIPLVSIIESLQVKSDKIKTVTGKTELYMLREEYISIIRLYDVFNVQPDSTRLEEGLLVVVEGDGQRAAILVDELLAQQQVVIKSLETNYHSVKGISGATILGDGAVALILDIPDIIDCSNHEANGVKKVFNRKTHEAA